MTDSEEAAYADVKETREREMRKSLDIAISVWNFLGDVMQEKAGEDVKQLGHFKLLNIKEVDSIISKEFGAPLHEKRLALLRNAVQGIIMEDQGINSCGLWRFAHACDHGLYDDLSLL